MPRQPEETPARKPSEIFAERVREIREAKRWTQQDLAERLDELGAGADRATVARTENGKRGITLDNAVTYCAALGAPLLYMIVGVKVEPVAIAPGLRVSGGEARRWARGMAALRPEDDRTYITEVPEADYLAGYRAGLSVLLNLVQDLVDAAANRDRDAEVAAIDRLNVEVDRWREGIDRETEREERLHHGKR